MGKQGKEPMRPSWAILCGVLGLALATVGCRWHTPIDVQPPKEPEVCSEPPHDKRYDLAAYPKEAFKTDDPLRKGRDLSDPNNPITPVRAPMGGAGPGMMPGARPY